MKKFHEKNVEENEIKSTISPKKQGNLICVYPVIKQRIKTCEINNHIDHCVVVYPISVINRKSSGHQFIPGSYLLSAALQHHMINKIIVTLFRGN